MGGPAALVVKESTVMGGGVGLFAAETIAPFVVIGEYVGVLRDYAGLSEKISRVGHDALHPFYLGPGLVVDPTDDDGGLDPASLNMAYTNEPAPSMAYNLLAVYCTPPNHPPTVFFVTRDKPIEKGDELFVCYGYDYDRLYAVLEPDVVEDARLREEIHVRHPTLLTEFPLGSIDASAALANTVSADVQEFEASQGASLNDSTDVCAIVHEVGTEEWRKDLSDVALPVPTYDSDSD